MLGLDEVGCLSNGVFMKTNWKTIHIYKENFAGKMSNIIHDKKHQFVEMRKSIEFNRLR